MATRGAADKQGQYLMQKYRGCFGGYRIEQSRFSGLWLVLMNPLFDGNAFYRKMHAAIA